MPDRSGLAVEGLALEAGVPPLSIVLPAGSIVGLAGLEGHGQQAFLECLAGLRAPHSGRIAVLGGAAPRPLVSFRGAAANGVVYLPRDRRREGIFPNLSVLDNFAIASMRLDRRGIVLSQRNRRSRYDKFRDQLSVVARNPDLPITSLSGGNQQKILLARLLARDPKVLLLNDPTRGVDIATRRVLYEVFRKLATGGMSLIVLSSEIEEAVTLCDRILVFRENALAANLEGEGRTNERVIAAMFGRAA